MRAGEAAVSATEPRYVCIDQKCKKLGPPGLQHVKEAKERVCVACACGYPRRKGILF